MSLGRPLSDMTTRLRKPQERTCERCGRRERWDEESFSWRVVRDDGDPRAGSVYCVHEWDIDGTFAPFADAVDS
jgi:hypothetical protein